MTETPLLQTTGVQTSGGFRIESRPDQLIVWKNSPSIQNSVTKYLAYVILGCTLLVALASGVRYFLAMAFFVAMAIIHFVFDKIHNVRCTRDTFEVIDISHGRTVRTRSFPRPEVKRVRYGAVSYSKYGASTGLVFTVQDKEIKALYGLKCVEAQKVLSEIERLGYDVEHDVAMPMTVETELDRRKSWFWNWFGS